MIVDSLAMRGIEVVKPTDATFSKLLACGAPLQHTRVVDLTLEGVRYEVMKRSLEVMLSAPEFGTVIAVVGSSARFQPELTVQPVIDIAASAKPLAVFVVPDAPNALQMLAEANVPTFRTS